MPRRMRLLCLLAAVALGAAGFVQPAALAAAGPWLQGGPSLENRSFEGAFNPWQTWSIVQGSDCKYQEPEFLIHTMFAGDPLHVLDGHDAARITIDNDKAYWAGLRQTVDHVTPGMILEFRAWVQMDANLGADKTPSNLAGEPNMRVGIDPTGGNSPTNPDIAWSAPENRYDSYYQVSVQAVARADHVTVFISSNPTVCQSGNSTYIDEAELEVVGTGPIPSNTPVATNTSQATTPPTAAPTDTSAPQAQATRQPLLTPTPAPDGAILYTVQPGDTLTAIAVAAGITVEELQALNGLTDSNIVIGQQLLLATAPPTETATAVPTETAPPPSSSPPPTQGPTATPVDPAGKVCVAMFEDEDADGAHDPDEALLAGGTLRLSASISATPLAEYETSGTGEPYCFEPLEPATYMVAAAGPEGYTLTKDAQVGVLLPPQGELTLEFGAQRRAGGGAGAWTVGGLIALLAAGGSAAFIWRRRRRPLTG